METVNVLNVPFYKFKSDSDLTKEIYECCRNLKFSTEEKSGNGYIYPNFYHKELFSFFNECIQQVQQLYFKDSLTFPIVDCWINKYTALNKLYKHNHSNSVICGVFYVTSHGSENSTIFEITDPWSFYNSNSQLSLSIDKNQKNITGKITPEEGTLILFPSPIAHYMNTIKTSSTLRYTIAFNTFPSGMLSNNQTQNLSIATTSLEERILNV